MSCPSREKARGEKVAGFGGTQLCASISTKFAATPRVTGFEAGAHLAGSCSSEAQLTSLGGPERTSLPAPNTFMSFRSNRTQIESWLLLSFFQHEERRADFMMKRFADFHHFAKISSSAHRPSHSSFFLFLQFPGVRHASHFSSSFVLHFASLPASSENNQSVRL